MKLGTRLLLPLLATVVLVMAAYAFWAVRQRERTLTEHSRRETHAYAVALGLAIEAAFRSPAPDDIQPIIDQISEERSVSGVYVYDAGGDMLFVSNPLTPAGAAPREVVVSVLSTGQPTTVDRMIEDTPVHAVVRPIRAADGRVLGAFEVAQPLAFLEEEIATTRQRFLLNTLTLLAALTVLILGLVRTTIARPLGRIVAGAQAIGRGELAHRIDADVSGEELAEMAREFNRMAADVESAQAELVRESDERVQLERRLRESEKLAAIGNLAAALAHEIGAPLHVIRGRAEMLLKREASETERRNQRIIIEQISRITVIVRNLLDFARPRVPRLEPIDLVSVVRGVTEFLDWEMQRAGITLEWQGPEHAWVRGDANQLHQVFINLLMNAMQAVEVGNGQGSEQPPHVCIRVIPPTANGAADSVGIEIEDNGPGVPEANLSTIFEPFFTTKHHGAGTGLGLAVARTMIEEHQGRIEVENALAEDGTTVRGARFRILLPAASR